MLIALTFLLRPTVLLLLPVLLLHINMSISIDHTAATASTQTTTSIDEECNVIPSMTTEIDPSNITTTTKASNIRLVQLPARTLLEDILLRYYGTNHDTYYEQSNHEDICRVRLSFSSSKRDTSPSCT